MILADTSVWIDHLRSPLAQLAEFMNAGQILMHSIIVGELACGNLSDRRRRLRDWQHLPMIPEAGNQEVLSTIESRQLMGQGARTRETPESSGFFPDAAPKVGLVRTHQRHCHQRLDRGHRDLAG